MNQDLKEAQEIGKAYAAQHITVEDLAYQAHGKANAARAKPKAKAKAKKQKPSETPSAAKAASEPLTIKKEVVMNGVMAAKKEGTENPVENPVPQRSAHDCLVAAKKERAEKGWLFCDNDMEVETALERAAAKEKRLNIATRNAQASTSKPKQPRATPLQAEERRLSELQAKLSEAEQLRDATNAHISKLTQERPHADAERQVVIKGALEILRGEQLAQADKVSQLKDDVRMAEDRLASIHRPALDPVAAYEDARKRYEAGKISSVVLAQYKEAARVAILRGEVRHD